MIRLAISVEGRTEEETVNRVLRDHLRRVGIETTPVLLGRARDNQGGGDVSIGRLVRDMSHLAWSFDAVTSLVDYYGFRGKGNLTADQLEQRVTVQLRKRLGKRWSEDRVIPYVQRHEFEGLLFSDVSAFEDEVDLPQGARDALSDVRHAFATPEDIDDGADTAPSKRIASIIPAYRKPVHGPLLVLRMGVEMVCGQCPRFAEWLTRLEGLGRAQ